VTTCRCSAGPIPDDGDGRSRCRGDQVEEREKAIPDVTSDFGRPRDGFFRNLNRGKTSIVSISRMPRRGPAARPVRTARSVRSSPFARHVDRIGIGYQAGRARKPGIAIARSAALGQEGTDRGRTAHDLALEAEALPHACDRRRRHEAVPAFQGRRVAGLRDFRAGMMATDPPAAKPGSATISEISMHDVTVAHAQYPSVPPLPRT